MEKRSIRPLSWPLVKTQKAVLRKLKALGIKAEMPEMPKVASKWEDAYFSTPLLFVECKRGKHAAVPFTSYMDVERVVSTAQRAAR